MAAILKHDLANQRPVELAQSVEASFDIVERKSPHLQTSPRGRRVTRASERIPAPSAAKGNRPHRFNRVAVK